VTVNRWLVVRNGGLLINMELQREKLGRFERMSECQVEVEVVIVKKCPEQWGMVTVSECK
jgi:hypothetical protein